MNNPNYLTQALLARLMPAAEAAAVALHAEHLERAMQGAQIDTLKRRAAFLAQLAHESGSLRYVEEIADGQAYEGRDELGNTEPGDGKRFKGRAFIQITGRTNYQRCGEALKLDLLNSPGLLTLPENASRASAWFWAYKQLNQLADQDKFGLVTKRVNGGYNGLDERIGHWLRIRRIFGI